MALVDETRRDEEGNGERLSGVSAQAEGKRLEAKRQVRAGGGKMRKKNRGNGRKNTK
jgi:hypothetical protein